MLKSSTKVPFVIIITLIMVVSVVVIVKSSYSGSANIYDVLGIIDSKTTHDESDTVSAPKNDSNYEKSNDENHGSDEEQKDTVSNSDISNKNNFKFNKSYYRAIDANSKSDTIKFFTTNSDSDYRINIKTKVSDTPLSGSIYITIYDERGITVVNQNIQPRYDDSLLYRDEFNIDFRLEKSKNYTLKISCENSGDYQITMFELKRDAGDRKETATVMTVGEEINATINSTLADWYICNIAETGKYKLVFHNIEINNRVSVSGTRDDMSCFSITVKDSTSGETTFFARAGDKLFVSIKPQNDAANGKYIMTLNKVNE